MTRAADIEARAAAELARIEREARAAAAADRMVTAGIRLLIERVRELIQEPSSRCVVRVRQAITCLGRPPSRAVIDLIDRAEALCQAVDAMAQQRAAAREALTALRLAPAPDASRWQSRADLQ